MHGRLRIKTTKEQEEELKIREREKAFHFRHLSQRIFQIRPHLSEAQSHDEYFRLTKELLLINPDFYTVWNIRKETLLAALETDPGRQPELLENELAFTMDCLKINEKSYTAWHHRKWVLSMMPKSAYKREIKLCNMLLSKDERNFHVWNYRGLIWDKAGEDLKSDFNFTTEKILSNFSNYSAWHRRHIVLLKALDMPKEERPQEVDLEIIWPSEYKIILDAVYTDPADQSPWLYHNWLVRNNLGHLNQEHIATLEQLEELEPENIWIKEAIKLAKECCVK